MLEVIDDHESRDHRILNKIDDIKEKLTDKEYKNIVDLLKDRSDQKSIYDLEYVYMGCNGKMKIGKSCCINTIQILSRKNHIVDREMCNIYNLCGSIKQIYLTNILKINDNPNEYDRYENMYVNEDHELVYD